MKQLNTEAQMSGYGGYRVKDRSAKVEKRSKPKMIVTNRSIITVQQALAQKAQASK